MPSPVRISFGGEGITGPHELSSLTNTSLSPEVWKQAEFKLIQRKNTSNVWFRVVIVLENANIEHDLDILQVLIVRLLGVTMKILAVLVDLSMGFRVNLDKVVAQD